MSKDLLKQTIYGVVPMEASAIDALLACFSPSSLKKGETLAQKGEYSRRIAFINAGVLRAYFSTDKGEEYNKTFFTAGNFVGAYSALVTGLPNLIDIDCLTACELLLADYRNVVALYDRFPKIERMSRILAESFFVEKEKREIELVTLEAKDRYKIFLKEHPGLDQLIPQYHIASYLGVSPTQLSRIRGKK